MIIVNFIVNFCILVFKGIALLFNALIFVIKEIVDILWVGFSTFILTSFLLFEKMILALWRIFFKLIEAVCYVVLFIIKIIHTLLKVLSHGVFFVFEGLLFFVIYVLCGIREIMMLLYNVITKLFGGWALNVLKFIGNGVVEALTLVADIISYSLSGVMEICNSMYRMFILMGIGIVDFSIIVYKILIFLPQTIYEGIVDFIANFSATTERYVFAPIQNSADFTVKTKNILLSRIKALPEDIKTAVLEWYNNISFVKHLRNKRDMNRQILLIDFNSQDAKRSDKKIIWQYYAKDENGKFVRGIFEAFSKLDVHSFLMSEGYEVYDIKTSKSIEFFHGGRSGTGRKVKTKKMIFFLTQLSTYVRAGIPLTDAVRILSKQEKNKRMQRLYQSIIYELIMGENFSNALEKQGEAFPKLLVNMLKTSEMTGELAETLDDMADYYTTAHQIRKQTITSMMYPMVVLFFVIIVLCFIMIYVIPQFVQIYRDSSAELPQITVITIAISDFLKAYLYYLIVGIIVFALLVRFLYKKVKVFKTIIQWLVMHIPIIKNVIIYKEITMFTKTFSALLQHNVFITDSMEILSKVTNNEIYKMIVFDAISNVARGDNISSSFKNHWAIPSLAYEMMLTGERTGQLPLMMGKVATYYQEEQKNLVNQIKVLIEPIVIVFLTVVVGLILLSVVIPMFNLYSSISSGV